MTRLLVNLHRWVSVALCLLFATWFATGVVMIYVPFPSLPDSERITRADVLDVTAIADLPAALAATGIKSPNRLRLLQYKKRPMLVAEGDSGDVAASFADAAAGPVSALTAIDARSIADTFSAASVASVSEQITYDQWVVHHRFDPYRPFFRVDLADGVGTQIYISTKTTEVMQQTNKMQRAWNYVGAVVHWIYPTFIRKDWALWDQLVWWLSLLGIIGASAGMTLGVQRWRSASQRGSKGPVSPFNGWLGWHHKIGLVFGVVVLLWIFSGWLSMDHGRIFSVPDPTATQISDVRGMTLTQALGQIQAEDLVQFAGAKEIEITAFNAQAIVVARQPEMSELFVVGHNGTSQELSISGAELAVARAWPNSAISNSYLVPANDIYGNLREGSLPVGTLRIVLDDANETWIHVNLNDGRLVSVMDNSRRRYRWLFNGIHSLDFPGLVNRRPFWDIVIILLMLGGFIFSSTGVVIAYRRVVRVLIG